MIGTHLCFINIKLLMKAKVPTAVTVALKQKMIPSSDLFLIFINGTVSLQLQEATMNVLSLSLSNAGATVHMCPVSTYNVTSPNQYQ